MFKLCTNKNHSYKHNEQINSQNINNSECLGVKFVKIYPEMTSQIFWKNIVLVDYIGIFFYMWQYFWPHAVHSNIWNSIYLLTGYEGIASLLYPRHWLLTEAKPRSIVRVEGITNLLFPNTQSISILLYRKTLDS